MSDEDDRPNPARRPSPASRVAWSTGPTPYAYVPRRLLVRGDDAARHVDAVIGEGHDRKNLGGRDEAPEAAWTRVDGLRDPLAVVAQLRADGYDAQPDHVLFAHCDPCGCGPHPADTFDAILGDPYRSTPYRSTPYRSTPYRSTPYRSTPYRSTPYRSTGIQTSSALPAASRSFPVRGLAGPGRHPRITVLDTGLADGVQRPALLTDPNAPGRISGAADQPDATLSASTGKAVYKTDGWLDPVAGHGTFIAGLIEQLAPGCVVRVGHVVSPLGDARESDILQAILAEAALPPDDRPDILSLSFGGSSPTGAPALRSAIAKARLAGIVVVASAGNDGWSEPQYPAAYEDVVAVGALAPDGPAPWTNYGEWVDACAPGVDLVSAFFASFDGAEPRVNTVDPDHFDGWAAWSGTSFAAPVVVAALAREMVMGAVSAADAVRHVIHAPEALRIRCLGTVVNA